MAAKKILVVDDEAYIVELIQVNLEKAGYQVTTAYDGEEAWKKVEEERPDLIVSDVMMPKLDGFGLLKKLKNTMSTKSIPVVMLTAKASDQDVFKGWHFGADEYLTKPFNPAQLVNIVNIIFKSRAEEEKKRMEGKYVINLGNY